MKFDILWLVEEDKIKHWTISTVLILLFSTLLNPFWSFIVAMAMGLGKELIDKYYYKSGFCWYDMIANLIGCSLGFLIILISLN